MNMQISKQAVNWLRLSMLNGVGPMTARKLVRACGDITSLWNASASELSNIHGIGPKALQAIRHSSAEASEAEAERCRQLGIGLLCPDDAHWPEALNHADDAPLLLFYRGDAQAMHAARTLAVVGARRASREGALIARRWSRFLAERGICIVSGMAFGIDAAAHGGALEAAGSTVAVLGCGLNALNETQRQQAEAIAASGCVISEFLPELTARAEYFPRRNRIIAALAPATLVVEADLRSGSLITARQALEYGREVFAVPGSVLGGNHAGCHQLIRDGASLIEKPEQLMSQMGWSVTGKAASGSKKSYQAADKEEAKVLSALRSGPMHLDALAETCALTLPELSPILLRLELQGVIERLPGSRYLLSVELSET